MGRQRQWYIRHTASESCVVCIPEEMYFEFGDLLQRPAVTVLEGRQDPTREIVILGHEGSCERLDLLESYPFARTHPKLPSRNKLFALHGPQAPYS